MNSATNRHGASVPRMVLTLEVSHSDRPDYADFPLFSGRGVL